MRVAGVLRVTGGFAPGALCDLHQAVWLRECISGVGGVFEERGSRVSPVVLLQALLAAACGTMQTLPSLHTRAPSRPSACM